MKNICIVLSLLCLSVNAQDTNPVKPEFLISVNGQPSKFVDGETRTLEINGENADVSFSIGKFKVFDNYGVSFKVPKNTSAYIDESTETFDVWNFDFHDSAMILFVFKDNTFEVTEELLLRQLNTIAGNMNMEVSEPEDFSIPNQKFKGKSAIGKIGKFQFLLEEFGFSSGKNSFMAFYYSPLIERKSRRVDQIYKHFKSTIVETLVY